ncbi:hypothetical protein CHU95_14575 [Niveispirillum lacus]|uniref:DUF484 domain-containing protein n=2 Tax=Niveispirillum lacus TaxID=1981099 RepID=A0A255YXD0_9PROT|nr:hypothetical protein CHU95_14575 [Niveispirillum lacus]
MDELTAEDVAAFLLEHPDFLARRPDLLRHLLPPSGPERGQGIVDLRERILEKLRGEVGRLSDQQQLLVDTTRANMMNLRRVHAAVLHLLSCRGLEAMVQAITSDLAVLLDLDAATLVVEQPSGPVAMIGPAGLGMAHPGTIHRAMGRADVALQSDILGSVELWGHQAGLIRSQALVRLRLGDGEEMSPALLAFGSADAEMFHPGQATDLLLFLAGVVERVIAAYLDPVW